MSADFRVLSQAEIDTIVPIMDTILKSHGEKVTVKMIKDEFGLTPEQYNMVYDFCMPLIRQWSNTDGYWKVRYSRFKMRIVTAIRNDKSELAMKIRNVIGSDNEAAKKLEAQFHTSFEGKEFDDEEIEEEGVNYIE